MMIMGLVAGVNGPGGKMAVISCFHNLMCKCYRLLFILGCGPGSTKLEYVTISLHQRAFNHISH